MFAHVRPAHGTVLRTACGPCLLGLRSRGAAWQAPSLRVTRGRSVCLGCLADHEAALRALQRGARRAKSAEAASRALWSLRCSLKLAAGCSVLSQVRGRVCVVPGYQHSVPSCWLRSRSGTPDTPAVVSGARPLSGVPGTPCRRAWVLLWGSSYGGIPILGV